MKTLRLVAAALLCAAYLSMPAFAQEAVDTIVEVPIGDWIVAIGAWVGPLLLAVFMWLIRKLPAQIVAILVTARVDQLLERGIDYAINATAGAAKDKTLSFNVGSAVAEKAVQYAIDNAPVWLLNWMGGPELIRQKIIARLDVEPTAALR